MTISGHRTTSVFRRYNVVTDEELQDVKWKSDTYQGGRIGGQQPRKIRETGSNSMKQVSLNHWLKLLISLWKMMNHEVPLSYVMVEVAGEKPATFVEPTTFP